MSDYAVGIFDNLPSRKSVKKAIKSGKLLLNDAPTDTGRWMEEGMKLTLIAPEEEQKTYELAIPVIYEDDWLAIVNKPAGLPTSGNIFKTLENTLTFNLQPSNLNTAYQHPVPVHRLDSATSGLVIVAKEKKVRVILGEQLAGHQIQKTYQAVVKGHFTENEGLWNQPIENKEAISLFKLISTSSSKQYSLLQLTPKTGRTHQLRIHCAEADFPIVGDKLYGEKGGPGKGLFLCATDLSFAHPITHEILEVSIKLPRKFEKMFLKIKVDQDD